MPRALFLLLLVAVAGSPGSASATYRNPVIPGFHPDPSVCRRNDEFFLVTSSFEYFPGIPLFRSKDLVNWEQVGHVLTRRSQLDLAGAGTSAGIYAATIRCFRDQLYVIATNTVTHRMFFVTADARTLEWSEPTVVTPFLGDPSLLFDEDGRVYVTGIGKSADGKHDAIAQFELDSTTGNARSPTRVLWNGTGGKYPEGPHLYRIGRRYVLLIAEGGSEAGHMVTVARSRSPWGPFESDPRNPILTQRDTSHIDGSIQGTGHGDLVQAADGSWWMVFLGYRIFESMHLHTLGRETYLAPVSWSREGWPVVYGARRIEREMEARTLPLVPVPTVPPRDDFSASRLAHLWNFLRNPDQADWSLTERPGWLRLRGSSVSLGDKASPAWVGRRLDAFEAVATASLEFQPGGANDEAGLTVFMNRKNHYDLFVTRRGKDRRIQLRFRLGEIGDLHADEALPPGPVRLRVTSKTSRFVFAYASAEGPWRELGTVEAKYLATEVASGFTGLYVAMFATGNGHRSGSPADFDWFEYERREN